MLEKGALLESVDGEGKTALMLATCKGHAATVRGLLEKGALLEAVDKNGKTALNIAEENDRCVEKSRIHASEKAAPPQASRSAEDAEDDALLDAIRQIKTENPDFTVQRVWTTMKEKGIVVSEGRVYWLWPQVGAPTNKTEAEAKTAAEAKANAEAEAKAAAEYTEKFRLHAKRPANACTVTY